jgi:hypothetical protein
MERRLCHSCSFQFEHILPEEIYRVNFVTVFLTQEEYGRDRICFWSFGKSQVMLF